MFENWKPVSDLPGYEVSDQGRVRSWKPGNLSLSVPHTIELSPMGKGYLMAQLYHKGRYYKRGVHRMVLEAFVGPCPTGMEACHHDDVKINNTLTNLRWDTKKSNAQDMLRNGRHWAARKTHCKHNHEFTPQNTRHRGRRRDCLTCESVRNLPEYRQEGP